MLGRRQVRGACRRTAGRGRAAGARLPPQLPTHARAPSHCLPPLLHLVTHHAEVERSILGDGCIVEPDAKIIHSVVGLRSIVREVSARGVRRSREEAGRGATRGLDAGRGGAARRLPCARRPYLLPAHFSCHPTPPPPLPHSAPQGCIIEDGMLMLARQPAPPTPPFIRTPPQGCIIEDSMLMGADFYEQYDECEAFAVSPAQRTAA